MRPPPTLSTRSVMAELEAVLGPLVGGRVYRAPKDGIVAPPYITAAQLPDAAPRGPTLSGVPALAVESWELVAWGPDAEALRLVSRGLQAALRDLRTQRIAGCFVRSVYDSPEPSLRLRGAAHRVDIVTREIAE